MEFLESCIFIFWLCRLDYVYATIYVVVWYKFQI